MEAKLELETENPGLYKKILSPELKNTPKLSSRIETDKKKIKVNYRGRTFASVRAGITTFLRLAKSIKDFNRIER